MSRYRPYPKYKDSGLAWLGKIPAHWTFKRLRFVADLNPSPSGTRRLAPDTDVSFIPMEAVGEYGGLDRSAVKPLSDVGAGYTFFQDGDVVVAKITPCFENGKGALAIDLANGIAFGTTELHVLRAHHELDEKFLLYLSLSQPFRSLGQGEMYGAGGQKRVPESFVRDFRQPIPPLHEQHAIATFLDRETARIDALVAKKERLIELLHEKRTALITRVVTGGLDPGVPMRDSGVQELGTIPAHWALKRLWHLVPSDRRIMYGIVLPGPNVSDGVPIVKGGDVSTERLRINRLNRTTREIESRYARSRLRGGDLVYAIRGSIGEVAVVPKELAGANLTQDAARVAYTDATHGPWLLLALKSAAVFGQLEAGSLGATIRGINIRDLKRALIPVPPLGEQRQMADTLNGDLARFDDLVNAVDDAIERLNELRASLVAAAVTGKVDVREEAA